MHVLDLTIEVPISRKWATEYKEVQISIFIRLFVILPAF